MIITLMLLSGIFIVVAILLKEKERTEGHVEVKIDKEEEIRNTLRSIKEIEEERKKVQEQRERQEQMQKEAQEQRERQEQIQKEALEREKYLKIINYNSDEDKIKELGNILSEKLRVKIILNLKNDENKIECLNYVAHEALETTIIKSLKNDKNKIECLKYIIDEKLKVEIVKSLNDDEGKIKYLRDVLSLKNELKKTYNINGKLKFELINSLKTEEHKRECLKYLKSEGVKAEVIKSFRRDEDKLKSLHELSIEELKAEVIETFLQDENKIEQLKNISDINCRVGIISTLSKDEEKIEYLKDILDGTLRTKIIKSFNKDENKIQCLKYIPDEKQRGEIVKSLKDEGQRKKWEKLIPCGSLEEKTLGWLDTNVYSQGPEERFWDNSYIRKIEVGKSDLSNVVNLSGRIVEELVFSHEVYYEKFYKTKLEVKRLNGSTDTIPIIFSEKLFFIKELQVGTSVSIIGQFRQVAAISKLETIVFVRKMIIIDASKEDKNEIYLEGFVGKKPNYRQTPFGREISDLVVTIEHAYKYIPCIAWGRNAKYSESFTVGDKIELYGRIQSREYDKEMEDGSIEKKVAYEVSVSKLNRIEE